MPKSKRKAKSSKGHLLSSASSMASLGQWIQQSTESLTRATHPLMEQMRAQLSAPRDAAGPLAPSLEKYTLGEVPMRAPRASQTELAAALRNRGGATKKACPEDGSPCNSPRYRNRRASAPALGAEEAMQDGDGGGVLRTSLGGRAGVVPALQLGGRGGRSSVGLHEEYHGSWQEQASQPETPSGHTHEARQTPTTARGSSNASLVSQLEEFFRRGTPRASSGFSRLPPPARLDHRLANWSRARGLVGSAAPRLLGDHAVRRPPPALPHGMEGGERPPSMREAAFLWRGISVEVLLESAAMGPGFDVVLVGAHTDCGWAEGRLRIAAAVGRAVGRPLEAFLDALLEAWQEADGGSAPATTRGTGRSSARGSGLSCPGAKGLPCGSPTSSRGSCVGSSAPLDTVPDGDESGTTFGNWLSQRPPLWRFDHASRGLAWDFPASKAEKRELLLLQLFAEEGERQAQLASLRAALPLAFGSAKCV